MTPRHSLTLVLAAVATTATLLAGCGSAAPTSGAPAGAAPPAATTAAGATTPAATTSECGSVASPCTGPSSSTGVEPTETSPVPTTAQPRAGSYIDHAAYEANKDAVSGTKVVLFFHAEWCPICEEVEDSLEGAPVPAGLTVVKVDYDNALELRQRYGVTIQHTFVQVDPAGLELAKWSTGTKADEILGKTV